MPDQRVSAIVIHHRNYPGILETVRSIIASGVPADRVLVVDNSEDGPTAELLRRDLPAKSQLLVVSNRGYGSAVNEGVLWLNSGDSPYVLIATHETRPSVGAMAELSSILDEQSHVAVVGPLLVDANFDNERVWSAGGSLSRFLRLPLHVGHGEPRETYEARPPALADWLDGAFCLYRRDVFVNLKFSEDYFMYFEETDFHTALRRQGWEVMICPSVVVSQSSGGIPPYYLARNSILYYTKFGSKAQGVVSPAILVAKATLRSILKGRWRTEIPLFSQGVRDAVRTVKEKRSSPNLGSESI